MKIKGAVNEAKLKAGVLNSPQVCSLIEDAEFSKVLNQTEMNNWFLFVDTVPNFIFPVTMKTT